MDNVNFRAYIKSLKWMVPITRIDFDCKTVEVDLSDGNGDLAEYDFDEIALMRSTGLQSAKSYRGDSDEARLMFEGDVIKSWDGFLYEVVFRRSRACFWAYRNAEDNCSLAGLRGSIEIIGTIHENPELLGKEL